MPLVPPIAISNQITPSGNAPYTQQYNFGQAIGQILAWNPNVDSSMAATMLNDSLRKLIDRRTWWGLMTKGQIVTPGFYSTGQVSTTLGSNIITGIGTAWTSALVGQSIRVGYTSPIYNIIAVPNATTLTIELPFGCSFPNPSGYFITQYYYSIPNIKYIYSCKNLQLQYRMWTNMPQSFIETEDPPRLRIVYPWLLATMPPDANGNYQFELWPASMTQQALPYLAYVQPPTLVNDSDNFPPYFRGDIIVAGAVSNALRYRTKDNPYYSESVALAIAKEKSTEFEVEAEHMAQVDENLMRQDTISAMEQFPYLNPRTGARPGGGMYEAMSASSAEEDY
jgi:hypothetical protein